MNEQFLGGRSNRSLINFEWKANVHMPDMDYSIVTVDYIIRRLWLDPAGHHDARFIE